jgi:hypothetical protein
MVGRDNTIVENNTFVNSITQYCVLFFDGTYTNNLFRNNIIIQEGALNCIYCPSHGAEFTLSNNLYNKSYNVNAIGNGDIIGDPSIAKDGSTGAGLLDYNYFRLLNNSPAIYAGTYIVDVSIDYNSYLRPNPPSIGALEYTGEEPSTSIPTVTTTVITDISTNTATGGGNVTHDGSTAVTARGVCWDTTSSPTVTDSSTSNGTGEGSYVSYLTGLNSSTHYHVRAYATNVVGTAYGIDVSFNTLGTNIPDVSISKKMVMSSGRYIMSGSNFIIF